MVHLQRPQALTKDLGLHSGGSSRDRKFYLHPIFIPFMLLPFFSSFLAPLLFIYIYCFLYLKGAMQKRKRKHTFNSQMATVGVTETRMSSWSPTLVQEPKHQGHHLLLSQMHWQGAGLEAGQLGIKSTLLYRMPVSSGHLTYYTATPAFPFLLVSFHSFLFFFQDAQLLFLLLTWKSDPFTDPL